MRLFSLEYTQLLTESKNLKGEVVARTEESAEAGEEADRMLPERVKKRILAAIINSPEDRLILANLGL